MRPKTIMGKSTTMRLVLGLEGPTSGSARVGGRRYREFADPMRRVGAMLDTEAIWPGMTGRSHLAWLARAGGVSRRRVDEVLETVGLAEVAHRRVKGFSLGMRQRLGIAGSLLGDPGVLLLDEPVNGLDPEGVRWVRDLVRDLASEGRTVLISSHLMSEMAGTADRVVVIGSGRLTRRDRGRCRPGRGDLRPARLGPARVGPGASTVGGRLHGAHTGGLRAPLHRVHHRLTHHTRSRRDTMNSTHVPARPAAPGIAATLSSEWRKLWALPSNRGILIAAFGLSIGITLLMTAFGDTEAIGREQDESRYSVIFFGSTLAVWVFCALAANIVAAEYRSGAITLTLIATPHRRRVLTAKLIIVSASALVGGLAISLVNFALTQTFLMAAGGPSVSLSDPGALRAVLLYIPVSAFAQSLLAACAAVVLRSAPGAVVFTVLLGAVPIALASYLGTWWSETVPRHMTGAAAESLAGLAVPGTAGYLPALPAAVVVIVWSAVFTAVAMVVFTHRDA